MERYVAAAWILSKSIFEPCLLALPEWSAAFDVSATVVSCAVSPPLRASLAHGMSAFGIREFRFLPLLWAAVTGLRGLRTAIGSTESDVHKKVC